MTRIPYDQTAKLLLDGALEDAGHAEAQHEVSNDPQWIDVWFERDPKKPRPPGLIGRLATESCAFEVFHGALTVAHALDCLAKQLGVYRRQRRRGALDVSPMWLVTTARPKIVLQQMLAEPLEGWSTGFYRSRVPALPLYIVSVGMLPRVRDTLLLRLMGGKQTLRDALDELGMLPSDAWERTAATDAVAVLHSFAAKASIPSDPQERAILMSARETYQRIKNEGRAEGRNEGRAEGRNEGRAEGRNEGRAEGRNEGRAEGRRAVLVLQLERRFGEVPSSILARVNAADITQLDRWAEAVLDARTLEEVFSPSR